LRIGGEHWLWRPYSTTTCVPLRGSVRRTVYLPWSSLPGNAQSGLHSYEYDDAGRLITWSFSNTTVEYGWDGAGNRTSAGGDVYGYDARNRLTSGPDGVYTYTPRGDLATITSGATETTYGFDALGRLVDYNGQVTFSYDGLDRVATRNTVPFSYVGAMLDPVTDGTFSYGRSPAGRLVSQTDGQTAQLVGLDRHGDLTWLADTSGNITDTVMFDPFGDPTASSGQTNPTVGFQGDYTDPASGEVWMGARWYSGSDAVFRSRDTIFGELHTPISLNRYTYAWANPLLYWDPDGRTPGYIPGLDGPALPESMARNVPTNNLEDLNPATVLTGSDGSVYLRDDAIAMFSDEILATIVEEGRVWELISLVQSYNQASSTPTTAGDIAGELELALTQAGLTDSNLTTAEIHQRIGLLNDKFEALVFQHRDLALPRDFDWSDFGAGIINGGIAFVNGVKNTVAASGQVLCKPGLSALTWAGCATAALAGVTPDIPQLACSDEFSCQGGEGAFFLAMFMWSIYTAPTAVEQLATAARGMGGSGISDSIAADGLGSAATNGTRVFSSGVDTAGGAISLEDAARIATENGIDMRAITLRYEAGAPSNFYGFTRMDGAGNVVRAPDGRYIITLTDSGLSSPGSALNTIAHELNHIREINRMPGFFIPEEAGATLAGDLAELFMRGG